MGFGVLLLQSPHDSHIASMAWHTSWIDQSQKISHTTLQLVLHALPYLPQTISYLQNYNFITNRLIPLSSPLPFSFNYPDCLQIIFYLSHHLQNKFKPHFQINLSRGNPTTVGGQSLGKSPIQPKKNRLAEPPFYFILGSDCQQRERGFKSRTDQGPQRSVKGSILMRGARVGTGSFSACVLARINIIIARSVPIMEINSTPKQSQNHFQGYHIDLLLPFSLRSAHSRKGQQYERDGHWNQKQRLKYSVFLQFFQAIISDPIKKKRVRIYDMMSDMIVTRNSNQCRSHHQKMEKYRNSVPEIVASVAEKYEPSVYQELSLRYRALLKNLLENADKYIRSPAQTGEKAPGKGKIGNGKGKVEREGSHEAEGEGKEREGKVEMEVEVLPVIKKEALQGEEFLVDKKELKKTNDEYQQPALPDQEEDLPMMGLDPLSDDANDDQQPLLNLREQPYPNNPPASLPLPHSFPRSNFGKSGNYPHPHRHPNHHLDERSRFYYQQQIAALEVQRQWHVSTAEQLYSQWNNQLQNIKYCDEGLKMYNQLLASNRASQHRMGL